MKYLNQIVDSFNKSLAWWRNEFGCEANFCWNYTDTKSLDVNHVASIDVQDVVRPIYVRGGMKAVADERMKAFMDDAKEASAK